MFTYISLHVLRGKFVPQIAGRSTHRKPLTSLHIVIFLNNSALAIVDRRCDVDPVWRVLWISFFLKADAYVDLFTPT